MISDALSAIKESFENEVTDFEYDLIPYDPIWRDPRKGQTVYLFAEVDEPSGVPGHDTTGSREDRATIIVEFVQSAAQQLRRASRGQLERDEDDEVNLYTIGDAMKTWALSHTKTAFTNVTRFHHISTLYPSALGRELGVRYIRMTCHAFWDEVYPSG